MYPETAAVNPGIVRQMAFLGICSPHVVTLLLSSQGCIDEQILVCRSGLFGDTCLVITALESLIEEPVTECEVLVHSHC